MSEHIHKCNSCKIYTLKKECPQCNSLTLTPKPPKFSLEDKYANYRRKVKKEELIKKKLY